MSENNFTIVAKTMAGLESVLAEELKALGAKNIVILPRAVSFYGDKKLLYKANLWTRTALRILKFIKTFNIQNEQDIYKGVYSIDWEEWLSVDNTLAIDTVINNSFLTHSVFVSQKAKDAIVDQFRHKTGRRPSISLDNPDLRLNIYISGNNCTLSADSSGESLHKRGYRKFSLQAPINEVLAAGLIKLAGWNGNSNFVDPMCGSGTIVIEAALIALNIPPSYYRKIFGFEKWKDFEPDLWNSIKDKVPSLINNDIENEIIGADISPKAISIAKENIKSVGLQKKIKLFNKPIDVFRPPYNHGTVITNPPYGERLVTDNITELYKLMGNSFKKMYAGYDVWVISSDMQAIKYIGLHPSKKIQLYNGPLECKLLKFNIYKGSKKLKKSTIL